MTMDTCYAYWQQKTLYDFKLPPYSVPKYDNSFLKIEAITESLYFLCGMKTKTILLGTIVCRHCNDSCIVFGSCPKTIYFILM